jgi:hypothetical protein
MVEESRSAAPDMFLLSLAALLDLGSGLALGWAAPAGLLGGIV